MDMVECMGYDSIIGPSSSVPVATESMKGLRICAANKSVPNATEIQEYAELQQQSIVSQSPIKLPIKLPTTSVIKSCSNKPYFKPYVVHCI